ncbi:MAG: hypothetical protein ABJP82_24905, partial [Hyphomicrobiales bacterium]
MTQCLKLCPSFFVRFLAVAGVIVSFFATPAFAQDIDRGKIEEIVRDYLLKNPEIIA